jgi:hypothetical protein
VNYQDIFEQLWSDYAGQNPKAKQVHDLFVSEGEVIQNDHIALRTFNDPRVNLEVLSQAFIDAGYEACADYDFKKKKLVAKHFEHKADKRAPLVFISELKLEECSKYLQNAIKFSIDQIPLATLNNPVGFLLSLRPWGKPSYVVYKKLLAESEYAAWTYVYGYRANHFTVSINALKKYNTIEKVNEFVKSNGYPLNTSGGEIKGTPPEMLEQSSTMAERFNVEFQEGSYEIPSCFYEFARRYPMENGEIYTGFIAASADKIFESTNV